MRVFAWLLGQLPTAIVGWDRVEAVLQDHERITYGFDRLGETGGAYADAKTVAYLYPETEHADLGDESRVSAPDDGRPNGDRRGSNQSRSTCKRARLSRWWGRPAPARPQLPSC